MRIAVHNFALLFAVLSLASSASAMTKETLLGGVSDPKKENHSPETLAAAVKALEHINAKPEMLSSLNAQGPVSLGKIVEVKTQVVAGINYYMTLELEHQGKPFQASMVVWSRPWLEGKNSDEEPYTVSKLERKEPAQ